MSEDLEIILRESVILDVESINETTKRMVLLKEETQKEEIQLKENRDMTHFLELAYKGKTLGEIIYQIYDDKNLLGYASNNGKVILLKNTVDYGYIESGLTLNQTYLHDRYKIPEFVFVILVQQKIRNTNRVLKKGL